MKKSIRVFTINGFNYLGSLFEGVVTGIQMVATRAVTDDDAAEYVMAKQSGNLVEIQVGSTTDIISRSLTSREQLDFNAVLAEFKVAKKTADKELVNMVFDQLRGKKQ